MADKPDNLTDQLFDVIIDRKKADPKTSYVSSLYQKGLNSILKKIGEEAAEVIIAAKDGNKREIVHELSDLYFHCMVLMGKQQISPEAIRRELKKRFGNPGHEHQKDES